MAFPSLGYTSYRLSPFIKNGRRENVSYPVWVCSGTLINQWYVLTAAHCLKSRDKRIRHLRLGEWRLSNDPYHTSRRTSSDLPRPQVWRTEGGFCNTWLPFLGL